ncbi:hypothetical protein SS50377_27638 [Spironucleus salmonicida]|uniref:Uncharacterized protein n=1 Tax=Spironucleus salmonicida TaxID=348837 RepID=V6M0C4_9EUKA|nr:hypothetical protein SS50377_27638 [Spironucleus salmonicida]|eukprot:EST46584.1 Hypothetical protein SS50377_13388 [Spironucleus salmonicida]
MEKLAKLSLLKQKLEVQQRESFKGKRVERNDIQNKLLDQKMKKQLAEERSKSQQNKVDLSHAFGVLSLRDIQNSSCIQQGIYLSQNSQVFSNDSPSQLLFESQEDRTITPLQRLLSQQSVSEISVVSKVEKVIM